MGEQTRVLVVCDNEGMTHSIRESLLTSGYTVVCYTSGLAALIRLETDPLFDVIIVGLTSDVMDGHTFLVEVKERGLKTPARIILVGPTDEVEEKGRAYSLGAAEFVSMPFKLNDLILKIETQVNLQRSIKALRESEARFRSLAENSPDIVFILDVFLEKIDNQEKMSSKIVYLNRPEVLGYTQEEFSSEEFILNIHPNDVSKVVDQRYEIEDRRTKVIEFRVRSKQGHWEWVRSRSSLLSQADASRSILISYTIITERKQLELLERSRSRVLEAIAKDEAIEDALVKLSDVIENQYGVVHTRFFLFHDNTLLTVSNYRNAVFGLEEKQNWCNGCPLCMKGEDCLQAALKGEPVIHYQPSPISSTGNNLACSECTYVPGFISQAIWCIPIQSVEGELLGAYAICHQNERIPLPVDDSLFEMINQLASLAIERHQLREQLIFQAQHDALTGLMNLYTFAESLQNILTEAQKSETRVGLFFLDLDRFRWINETLGHFTGDQILIQVSERLKRFSNQTEALARVGADHYTLIARQVEDIPMILGIGQSILECFTAPFYVGDHEILITASMGISVFPEDGQDATTLLKHADQALQQAKLGGRNDFQRFNLRIGDQAAKKLHMENNLRRAIERNEFSLNYQPIIHLRSHKLAGVEALLRWNSPELGPISPVDFIPLAEETGLIVPIGNWVLEEACRQMKQWTMAGIPVPMMSVNISSLQFQRDDFLTNVSYQMKHNQISPDKLQLEVTESVVMQDIERIAGRLNKLHGLGLQIWIDDFGTGYSSLQYLRRLPVSGLKIDQSFLRGLFPSEEEVEQYSPDPCFYQAIVDLGHSLNLLVTAEGVETEDQMHLISEMACDLAQGFYFSRPIPAAAVQELI